MFKGNLAEDLGEDFIEEEKNPETPKHTLNHIRDPTII